MINLIEAAWRKKYTFNDKIILNNQVKHNIKQIILLPNFYSFPCISDYDNIYLDANTIQKINKKIVFQSNSIFIFSNYCLLRLNSTCHLFNNWGNDNFMFFDNSIVKYK